MFGSIINAVKNVVSNAGTIVKTAAVTAAVVYTGGAALAAAGVVGAGYAASAAMTAFTMTALSTAATIAFAPGATDPGAVGGSADDAITGQLVTTKIPNANARIVYGKTRVAGNVVAMDTDSGNKYLYMVMTLAGHEISSVSKIYADDQVVKTNPAFNTAYNVDYQGKSGFLRVEVLKGTDAGSQSSIIQNRTIGSGRRFKGLACLVVRLKYDQDVWTSGVPNFTVELTGKNSSSNAATAIEDYLTDTTYGLGVTSAEIDSTAFSTAETTCNENVALKGGGTEKRYTINGAFDSGESPQAILEKMLAACAGRLTYIGGKWSLVVGEYFAPTVEITEDDIVGSITTNTADSRRDTFNAVKGTYSEPNSLYNPQTYSPIENSTYEAQDGEQIFKEMDFQLVTSNATCQRLAKIALEKARQQIVVNIDCNLKAFKVKPGDTVELTFDRYGWSQKEFEVLEWNADLGKLAPTVNLTLRETAAGVYDWDSGEETEADLAENTNLPDPLNVLAPGISISDELDTNAERVITKLIVDVTSDSFYGEQFEVQAKLASTSTWVNLGRAQGNRFELLDVKDGLEYNVRARAVNTLGVRSAFTTGTHQVVGKTAPPSDVTGLAGNLIGNQYLLSWNAVSDLDLSYYRIRFASDKTANPTYRDSISLVPKVSRPATSVLVPARNGTYFVKAVDKLGLASRNPATIVLSSDIDGLNELNVVQTINEHPDFPGTFDDVVEIDEEDRLVLDTSLLFDDVTGDFDDAEGLFDAGFGNIEADGFYYFSGSTDLGAVFTSRLTASIKHVRVDYSLLFDSVDGLFDDREGDFDGDPDAFDDTNAELQIRVTSDDPTGTPTWSAWQPFVVGDYKFWGAEYRVKMTTTSNESTPAVSELTVTVDMPDRTESQSDLETSSGVKVVTFPAAFKETPAIGIGAQDMQTGDYYEITSKSRSGFTITFRQSSGAVVSTERTFDYVAKGYGRETA